MLRGLFNRKHKTELLQFMNLNQDFSHFEENGTEYISIKKSAKLELICSLLEVVRTEKLEIAFHDTIHPTISDPGAYFSYSTQKTSSQDVWSMTYGNHGWSGGIYHIKTKTLAKQIWNLIQNDKIDRIQVTNVVFFNNMDLKSEQESNKKDHELSLMHD